MTDCLFCKIAAADIPVERVLESENFLVFPDIAPQAPTHLLAIPKVHTLDARSFNDTNSLGGLMQFATQAAKQAGLDDNGYRLVINTGKEGGQAVFHLHVHVLGGRQMQWPPG